jgi:Flp pilus assembly pilin Flp
VTSLGWWVKAGVTLLVVLVAVVIVLLVQLLHGR